MSSDQKNWVLRAYKIISEPEPFVRSIWIIRDRGKALDVFQRQVNEWGDQKVVLEFGTKVFSIFEMEEIP